LRIVTPLTLLKRRLPRQDQRRESAGTFCWYPRLTEPDRDAMNHVAAAEPANQPIQHLRIDRLPRDPRYYQIAVLSGLLVYGIGSLDFDVGWPQVATLLVTVLISQFLCSKIAALPQYDPRSALISGLSLCLLLRANDPRLLVAAAVVTIAGKFICRWRGKHIFNPTSFGIVIMMVLTGRSGCRRRSGAANCTSPF
jgi:hypothetical protein